MKNSDKVPQSMKTRQDRLSTLQPFKLVEPIPQKLTGKNILIVDDVYTTGTTIRHAAQALRPANPVNIMGLTLSR